MKVKIIFLIISFILFLGVSTQINPYIFRGKKITYKPKKNKTRELEDSDGYQTIRIYPDFTYLNHQTQDNPDLSLIKEEVKKSFEGSINTLKKLIKVKPLSYPINKITSEDLSQWSFQQYTINSELLSGGTGVNTDLAILLKFIGSEEENLLLDNEIASISNKFILDETTKRPIVGVIYLSTNISLDIKNIDIYLRSTFLHEITHILGFHYDLFNYFPGGLSRTIKTEKEKRTRKEKKFIITPRVVKFAKKYFNCNEISGVELENQHNLTWSHWEARILLGEYMTSSPYTPEQVISEFTLSLLEDSEWYKVNYYTGGLMRFGKNKGCDFLNIDCIKGQISNFKFEFCDIGSDNQPACSSGRQSRVYCKNYFDIELKDYRKFGNFYGRINTDYCPVNDIDIQEEKQTYYVGNCKYGNGQYGTHNNFEDENLSNNDFKNILGEKNDENSFCILSSILPIEEKDKFESVRDSERALCYPMYCSSKSLTIQVFDQYIVCPREGGKVEVKGKYEGYLSCPDYNLICTGTKFCNNMFDCVEKESLSKEETYKYDYEINLSEDKIYKAEDIAELGEDGLCPKNCSQCDNKQSCLNCLNGYSFVKESKFSSNIRCIKKDEINSLPYCKDNNGVFYNCDWNVEKENMNEEIKEHIMKGNLDNIIQNYIEKSNNIDNLIIYYTSENLFIIIYKGKGNEKLIENISSINIKEIYETINEYYHEDSNKIINCIINENGNYYLSVYDEEGKKINLENECSQCKNIKININNNYEKNLDKAFGAAIKNVIINNKINIFDDEDKIFKDLCSNFTVSGIDIPIIDRKKIFYLGEDKNEIICGNQNCKINNDIDKENKLIGECQCDINLNLNDINKNNNENNEFKNQNKISDLSLSEKWKNSFQIFKCFNDTKSLKANEGFYISLCTLSIQFVCFLFYMILNPKIAPLPMVANPGKKTNTENKSQNNNIKTDDSAEIINKKEDDKEQEKEIKPKEITVNNKTNEIDNKIVGYGNIDEENEEKGTNNGDVNNTKLEFTDEKEEVKIDPIKLENKISLKLPKNLSKKSTVQEGKSEDEKIDINKNGNKNELNTIANTINVNTNTLVYTNTIEENIVKRKETIDNDVFSLQGSVNKKLNFKDNEDKEDKEFEEKIKNNRKVLILFGDKNKNLKNEQKKNKGIDLTLPLDYLPLEKAIKFDKRTFGILYWSILSFKQHLINIFSFFTTFKITPSCIPIQMKLIRFLLMLILNMFINSMTITQNYFKKKYEYFNEKYQIEESESVKIKIDPLERLSYAMTHCFPEVIITFFVCMIVQFIINFIFFGIRRELCIISINEKKENIQKEVQKLIKKAKIRYIIFAFINLIFMIVFFVYLTNFSSAYSGGALDYIGAAIWTFIFLQILPFISSLIIATLRHYGMKNKSNGLYKFSQVLLA